MKTKPVPKTTLKITTKDGRTLAGVWWRGADAESRTLIILPGLAIPQSTYHFFAKFLAEEGFGVLTFDYRGVGRSTGDSDENHINLDDWIHLDLPAAVDTVRKQCQPQFLAIVAHSIGGQLLGMSPIVDQVNGALLIAAQRGIPRLFKGKGRLAVFYAYTFFPILIRLFGRLPVSKWTFPVACPADAVRQWVRWGRAGVFTNWEGKKVENRFQRVRFPIISAVIEDDVYAPEPAVKALARLFVNADPELITISPKTYAAESIGHFNLFHRKMPKKLWQDVGEWLKTLEKRRQEQAATETLS